LKGSKKSDNKKRGIYSHPSEESCSATCQFVKAYQYQSCSSKSCVNDKEFKNYELRSAHIDKGYRQLSISNNELVLIVG
jgi:hypothetical protein